jgi:redox-sensitive bicupin YhaK (pirin superfamily)
MITLRRAKERHLDRRHQQEVWRTFDSANRADVLADGFGALEGLDEDRLPPGASVASHSHHDTEMLTYVREGSLAYESSMGGSGVIHAGEFQRMCAGRGVRHSESNASRTDGAHVFRIWIRPWEVDLEPSVEQKRFSTAERRGTPCVVASPDARRGSLRIHQDALVCSAILDRGQHIAHELSPGRSAWLHVVEGEATLSDVVLSSGDGAGITGERAVSLTAREETEILLLDLGEPRRRSPESGDV